MSAAGYGPSLPPSTPMHKFAWEREFSRLTEDWTTARVVNRMSLLSAGPHCREEDSAQAREKTP